MYLLDSKLKGNPKMNRSAEINSLVKIRPILHENFK